MKMLSINHLTDLRRAHSRWWISCPSGEEGEVGTAVRVQASLLAVGDQGGGCRRAQQVVEVHVAHCVVV